MRLLMIMVTLVGFHPLFTQPYDLLIKNGNVYDGLGGQSEILDLAIVGSQIVRIDRDIQPDLSDRVIDASHQAVCPGFIDVHAHLEPLTLYPSGKSHVMQGVTTALGGPDGSSPFPLGLYLDSLRETGIGLNVAYLIGHNTVRNHVMGLLNRDPTEQELARMQMLIVEAMNEGAFGISTGLKYLPGTFAKTEEIITLARVAADEDGIYTSHLREEGLGLLSGVAEAIRIAAEAEIPVVLTHHKAVGQSMWGASKQTLRMVDSARAAGLDISMDQYPYTASHTWLGVVIPPWALEGHAYVKFAERCKDPVLRDSIKSGIIYNLIHDRGGNDLTRIQFARIDWKSEFAGRTLHDLVIAEGMEPTIENGAEMVIEIQLHRGAHCIYHVMADEDVDRIMQHPFTMIASDGRITPFGKGHPHPRAYGTFPRVLGHYVRERKLLTLAEAIRKMTSLPARRLGLEDRGVLQSNKQADIVIFDPETIIDKATFTAPHAHPEGISYVIINGKTVVDDGRFTGILAGEILRK